MTALPATSGTGSTSLVPGVGRARGIARVDAVTFLTVYLVLLLGVPSYLVIPALGSIGQLSVLWGLVGLVWWGVSTISRTRARRTVRSPVAISLAAFLAVVAVTYALAGLEGLPPDLSSTADSGVIRVLSWTGVALVALDGIRTKDRLVSLLHRFAWGVALVAALGLLQFVTDQPLVTALSLPGFSTTAAFDGTQGRGGFVRAAGTASHPLEYGALLCAAMPPALALGITARHRPWWFRWVPAATIGLAVALSLSRSTLLGFAVGLMVLAPRLPVRYLVRGAFIAVAAGGALLFVVPGLIGTILGMFSAISSDPGALSRASSSTVALEIAGRTWWTGHGVGTFLPGEMILDNQVLLTLLELGIFGLLALAALVGTSVVCAWTATRRQGRHSPGPDGQRLTIWSSALAAGVCAGSVTLLFFDGFSFPMTAGTLFLLYGTSGAAWEVLGPVRCRPAPPAR